MARDTDLSGTGVCTVPGTLSPVPSPVSQGSRLHPHGAAPRQSSKILSYEEWQIFPHMSTGIFQVPGALRNWSLFPPLEAGEELVTDLRKGHGGDAAWLPSLGHKGDTVPACFLARSSSPLGPSCHDVRKPKWPHGKVAWRCSSLSPQVTRSQLIAATAARQVSGEAADHSSPLPLICPC